MSDTTTELEVLNQIVDVLGGTSGQYETVVPTLQQILALLGGGGGAGGYNPSLSVGRADALTGADSTAQWMQRVTEGSGSATVRSVQGAAVVWNQMRDVSGFVRDVSRVVAGHVYYFSGISAEDADVPSGGYIRWRLYTMSDGALKTLATLQFTESGAHKVATRFAAAYSATSDGTSGNTEGNLWTYRDVVGGASGALGDMMLIDLTAMFGAGNEPSTVAEFEAMYPEAYYPYSAPTLKPVRIAGIQSTGAQGAELDSVEWTAQTLRAAGSVADMLYADHVDVNVGAADASNAWVASVTTVNEHGIGYVSLPINVDAPGSVPDLSSNLPISVNSFSTSTRREFACNGASHTLFYRFPTTEPVTLENALADMRANNAECFYPLATPTTTPISPALPMTYKVQAGGSESIVVPSGEISAAPILTVAEGESASELVMDALACVATPDGPTATANHALGTYLTMGGKLYKVTSAIAAGESIVAGTNVSQTTVMAELLALTA